MQDTVVDAFRGLGSFNQRSAFSTWLTRIAINNALLLIRGQKGKLEISFDGPDNGRPLQIADHRINPEQALIREQSNRTARRAVRALPSSLRAYVEHHICGSRKVSFTPRSTATAVLVGFAARWVNSHCRPPEASALG
jgi:RNA polymerase sigma-70 factor (ECF subfamily)